MNYLKIISEMEKIKPQIDRNSPIPIYHQLEVELEALITSGKVPPSSKIPGDVELKDIFKVSIKTIRRVLKKLCEKKLLTRRRKLGTFVSDFKQVHNLSIGFYYLIENEKNMLIRAEYIQGYLSNLNYDLKIFGYKPEDFQNTNIFDNIKKANLSGIIIVPTNTEKCKKFLLALENQKFPHIKLGNSFFHDELNSPLVKGNEEQCISSAIDYLTKNNHKNIGMLNFTENNELVEVYIKHYMQNGGYNGRWKKNIPYGGTPENWFACEYRDVVKNYFLANKDLDAVIVENPSLYIDCRKYADQIKSETGKDILIRNRQRHTYH
jgi:DNA-binding transcriptional regulator YhcF (GntR family)